MRLQKAERLFYIIKYFDDRETATAKELADYCRTSTRSIYRDMKKLEEIGYYFTTEGKRGYRLIHKAVQAPKNMTVDEWMAVTLFPLLSQTITYEKHPLNLAYRSGLEKMKKNVLAKNEIQLISSQLGERILFQDGNLKENCPNILGDVIEAIANNWTIHINYYSAYRDKLSERFIDPYYLILRSGHLYIIAFCHNRKDIRIFRLNRIHSLKKTEQHFVIQEIFNIQDFLANRWSIIADEQEVIHFVVKFDKKIARYINEHNFYSDTILTEQDDGSLLLKTKVKSKIEFLRWVRSFGLDAEVLEPIEIRNELKQEYERLLQRYR